MQGICVGTEKHSTKEPQSDKSDKESHPKKSLFASLFRAKRPEESTSSSNDSNRSRLPFLAIFQVNLSSRCMNGFIIHISILITAHQRGQ